MKNLLAVASLGGLLLLTSGSVAGPEKPVTPLKGVKIAIGARWSTIISFKGGERATAVVFGERTSGSFLAVYVYDERGDCVARHDDLRPWFLNDRCVIWYPSKTQAYTIEVRNLGTVDDTFTFAAW